MTTQLVPPLDVERRPRKVWDVALTVTLLVIATLFALGDVLFVATIFLFLDSSSDYPTLAWGLLAVLVWLAATIAAIVLLGTGRRAWWLAAASLLVSLVPVIVALPAFGGAIAV